MSGSSQHVSSPVAGQPGPATVRYVVCTGCKLPRGNQAFARLGDTICTYCVADRRGTPQEPSEELKWCIAGGHEIARSQFALEDGGEDPGLCRDCAGKLPTGPTYKSNGKGGPKRQAEFQLTKKTDNSEVIKVEDMKEEVINKIFAKYNAKDYPPLANAVTSLKYGKDNPGSEQWKMQLRGGDRSYGRPDERVPCLVYIQAATIINNGDPSLNRAQHEDVLGRSLVDPTEHDKQVEIDCYMQIQATSQNPCIKLFVGNALFRIFPGSIARDWETDGEVHLELLHENKARFKNFAPHPDHGHDNRQRRVKELHTLVNEGKCCALAIGLPDFRGELGAVPPILDGLHADALARIYDTENTDIGRDELAIRAIARGMCQISIFRKWPAGQEEIIKRFRDWFMASMMMSIELGSHWFYQTYLNNHFLIQKVTSTAVDTVAMPIPRWLVNSYRVSYDESGEIDKAVAETWGTFSIVQRYPDSATMAFALRMGVARDSLHQSRIIKQSVTVEGYSIIATVNKHPSRENTYLMDLRVPEGEFLSKEKSLRPRVDTRIEIEVGGNIRPDGKVDFIRNSKPLRLKGAIAPNVFGADEAEICIYAYGAKIAVSEGGLLAVKLYIQDDPTPRARYTSALEAIQQNPAKPSGVDICSLVLRAPKSVKDPGLLPRMIFYNHDYRDAREEYVRILKRWALNEEQQKAATAPILTTSGFIAISGPPGTGKTFATGSITQAWPFAGRKMPKGSTRLNVLCTASRNSAVDAAMTAFLKHQKVEEGEKPLVVVRWSGGFLAEARKGQAVDKYGDLNIVTSPTLQSTTEEETPVDNASAEEKFEVDNFDEQQNSNAQRKAAVEKATAEEVQEAFWQLVDDANPTGNVAPNADYSFGKVFLERVLRWSKSNDLEDEAERHPFAARASEYINLKSQVKEKAMEKEARSEVKEALSVCEYELQGYFLQHEVDIVYCTNSAAAHGVLRELFKPSMHISDEAALASIPDVATPMAAFFKSIQVIVLAGDHMQGEPIVTSRDRNEFSEALRISLFYMVSEDAVHLGENIYQLKRQYRMHPDIGNPVSKLTYKGDLVHDESTSGLDGTWIFVEHWLKGLGPAWNKRRRIGIDVSNAAQKSERAGNTTSMENEAEAGMVADTILALLNHVIPEEENVTCAVPVTHDDILVVTPYQGQLTLIKKNLIRNGVNKPGKAWVRLATFRAVQGDEAKYVFLSMVKNVPGKPTSLGFIQERNSLNVAMSRAKQGLFVVGNIRNWVQACVNEVKEFSNKGMGQYFFGQYFKDFFEEKDIVSNSDMGQFIGNGTMPKESEFAKQIEPKSTTTNNNRGRGGANNRGRGGANNRGRGNDNRGRGRGGGCGRGAASRSDNPFDNNPALARENPHRGRGGGAA